MKRGFLLGAGFTYDLGMPLVGELTDVFLAMFTEPRAKQLADMLSREKPRSDDRPINDPAIHEALRVVIDYKSRNGRNYEELLKEIELTADAHDRSQSDRDSFHYVFGILYGLIHFILVEYQNESYRTLYSLNSPCFKGFKRLLSEEGDWVFSLNHDLYVECLAIDFGIPITYGDVSDIAFPVSNLRIADKIQLRYRMRADFNRPDYGWIQGSTGINLVRLHGGLSEHSYKDEELICNPALTWSHSSELIREFNRLESMAYYHAGVRAKGSGDARTVTGPDGTLDILSRTMLTGGKKYSTTTNDKKGEEKLGLFFEVVRYLDELVIMGYSFGDSHINDRILNSMVLNPNLRIWNIDPIHRPWPSFLCQFDYGQRLRVATAGAAEWMTYASDGRWDNAQMEALKLSQQTRSTISDRIKTKIYK
jgi:hypothetical protein